MFWNALLVNPPAEDPALYVDLHNRTESYLVDCGDLRRLRVKDLKRITRVFVTHTHIDHFIGFDHLLRMQLFCSHTLEAYGPPGMLDCVRGKLSGYAWNLTDESPFQVRAHELHEKCVKSVLLPCRTRFSPTEESECEHGGAVALAEGTTLRFAPVDHNVECLAYRIDGPPHHRVSKQALAQASLPPGAWLKQLKEKVLAGEMSARLDAGSRHASVEELSREFLQTEPGPSLAYVTDTVFNRNSVASLMPMLEDVDVLWCEAAYRHAELAKARAYLHMTTRQAGRLAKQARAGLLHLFHLSRRYGDGAAAHLEEARQVFERVEPAPQYG